MQNFVKNIQKCIFSAYIGQANGQGRCRKSLVRQIHTKKECRPNERHSQEIISSYLLIDILQLRVVLSLEKRNLVYETL